MSHPNADPIPATQPQTVQVVLTEPNKKYGVTSGFRARVRKLAAEKTGVRLFSLYWSQTSRQRYWIGVFAVLASLCFALGSHYADLSLYEYYFGSAIKTVIAFNMAGAVFLTGVLGVVSWYPVWMLIHKSKARLSEGILIALALGGTIGSAVYFLDRIFSDGGTLQFGALVAVAVFVAFNTVLRGAAWGLWLCNVMNFQGRFTRFVYMVYGIVMPSLVLYPLYAMYRIALLKWIPVTAAELYLYAVFLLVYLGMFVCTIRLGHRFHTALSDQRTIEIADQLTGRVTY